MDVVNEQTRRRENDVPGGTFKGDTHMKPLFNIGRVVTTPNALAQVDRTEMFFALGRHQVGDWGHIPNEDVLANDWGLKHGARLMSVYQDRNQTTFWIITEADRSATTILLPEDY